MRVALVSSEAIRSAMAGIGIRYLEMARVLADEGFDVLLLDPGDDPPPELPVPRVRADPGRLADATAGCHVGVAQGQLANDLLTERPDLPCAVDLYDPWLIENFAYRETLGLDPYRNDHASWIHQMSRGDFFLCSSEEQRLYYLGFLTAVGRVHPDLPSDDPDLRRLVDVVPFGVSDRFPPHRPVLPPAEPGELRLLFGGLYDWYDPWTVLEAVGRLDDRDWRLYFVGNPNPGTPQELLREVEAECRRRGWWGDRVRLLPWVEADRRSDLLRDVDALVAPDRPSLETRLSFRTRFLDALAVGCPVVMGRGGPLGRLVEERRAGWVVDPGDAAGVEQALRTIAAGGSDVDERTGAGRRLAGERTWPRVLEPLVDFCRSPRRDATKESFSRPLATAAPRDGALFRLRRFLRRLPGSGATEER